MKKVHNDSRAAPPWRSTLKGIRRAALVILTALVTANANAQPTLSFSEAAQKGRTFLTNLFDPALGLLRRAGEPTSHQRGELWSLADPNSAG